jgi:hypothetical protein
MINQLAFAPLTHQELNNRARDAIIQLGYAALSCIHHGETLGRYEKQAADLYDLYQGAALQRCDNEQVS